jgi:hypothetical protein
MYSINSATSIKKNSDRNPGVYKIYWIREEIAQNIHRFLGTDNSGLLYIGQAIGSVQGRLNNFRLTAFGGSSNHSGGKKYKNIHKINSMIKPFEIFFEVSYCSNPRKVEELELKKYKEQFGEVPPLNG